jgi:monoamine oxidase
MLTASHDMLRPELASKRQGYLDFVPPLDAKRQEVIKFGLLGSYLKVALTFSNGHPRWPANVWVMGYDGRANFFDILMRPDNRDAAIVCLAGLDALVLDYDVNETRSFALEKVAQFYGSDIRAALVGATVTHWSQDPFALGAWAIGSGSYWVRGEERLAKIYATPHHDRVFFAGDATDTDTFAIGRVEGAWASGLRAAQEALAFLPKG